jgi:hypothetical protein
MEIEPDEVAGRLDFMHLRGLGLNIGNLNALPLGGYGVVIVDPVYKLFVQVDFWKFCGCNFRQRLKNGMAIPLLGVEQTPCKRRSPCQSFHRSLDS